MFVLYGVIAFKIVSKIAFSVWYGLLVIYHLILIIMMIMFLYQACVFIETFWSKIPQILTILVLNNWSEIGYRFFGGFEL